MDRAPPGCQRGTLAPPTRPFTRREGCAGGGSVALQWVMRLRAMRQGVLFPILHGPFTTGLVTAFVRAITTLSVVLFLFTPGTTVATITIFQLVNDFNWGGASAFTVAVIGMAIGVLLVVWGVSGRRVRFGEIPNG